jgi:asparagine synthase (glutamine-hydrolysing)
VPVGVALSGGFDSGLVAALLVAERTEAVEAFTVGYTGRPKNDERADARALADWLGIPHHEIELSESAAVAAFPSVVAASDDPIADMSALGYWAVARAAAARHESRGRPRGA